MVNERVEEVIWRSTLETEFTYYLASRNRDSEPIRPQTSSLQTYVLGLNSASERPPLQNFAICNLVCTMSS